MTGVNEAIFVGVCALGAAISSAFNPRYDQPLTGEEIGSKFRELDVLNSERADELLDEFKNMTGCPKQYAGCVCPSELPSHQWEAYEAKIDLAAKVARGAVRERIYGADKIAALHS